MFIRIRRGDPNKPVMLRLKDEARSMYSGVAGLGHRFSRHRSASPNDYYDNADGVAYRPDGGRDGGGRNGEIRRQASVEFILLLLGCLSNFKTHTDVNQK